MDIMQRIEIIEHPEIYIDRVIPNHDHKKMICINWLIEDRDYYFWTLNAEGDVTRYNKPDYTWEIDKDGQL